MPSPLFTSIHHVAIICSDYPRSRYFYNKILGFKIVNETYRSERMSYKLDLQIDGSTQIELFSFPAPPARPSFPEACGLRHLAFGVVDIVSVVDYLNQHGIKCEPIRTDELTGKLFTFFNDPDGLPLEIYQN